MDSLGALLFQCPTHEVGVNGSLVRIDHLIRVHLHRSLMHHPHEMCGIFFGLFVILLCGISTDSVSKTCLLPKLEYTCLFCFHALVLELARQATPLLSHIASVYLKVLFLEFKDGMSQVVLYDFK